MAAAKIAISIDHALIQRLDRLIEIKIFPNRSRAIQEAVEEKIARLDKNRLAKECAKLDSAFEQALAEEGMPGEMESWPEY